MTGALALPATAAVGLALLRTRHGTDPHSRTHPHGPAQTRTTTEGTHGR